MRDGWRRVRLDDAAEVTIGRQRSPRHATGSHLVPYMRAANVKDGVVHVDDVLAMNFTPDEQAVYRLDVGDVLVTEGCGSIRELGASARWTGDLPGVVCFQNTLLRLRARVGVAFPEFIEQWARWAYATGIWAGVGSGTNIFHIGVQRAREVPIDLPPLAEQRRIIDLVAAVDRARRNTEAQARALDHLRSSTLSDLLSGTHEIPESYDALLEST